MFKERENNALLAYLYDGTLHTMTPSLECACGLGASSFLTSLVAVLSIVRGAPGAGGMALLSCSLLSLLPLHLLLPVHSMQALHPPEGRLGASSPGGAYWW